MDSNKKNQTSYFRKIIQDILKNSDSNLSKDIIVLQNYTDAQIFKYKFLEVLEEQKIQSVFLPSFYTAKSFLSEFVKNNGQILLEYSQQIIILSKIINDYKEIDFSATESIKIATELYKIKEQISGYISLENINSWVEEDLAEHWWATSNLLETTFKKFDQEIDKYRISSDKKINIDNKIYIVGLIDISEDLLRNINSLECTKLFYSPIYYNTQNTYANKIKSIYSKANIKTKNIFEQLEAKTVKYHEFKDIYSEEDYIVHKAITRKSTLLIVTNSEKLNKNLSLRLDNLGIEYNSFFKTPYISFLESELFCNLAKFKSRNGSITSLSSVLNSRMMHQVYEVQKLLDNLNKSDLFFENFHSAKDFFVSSPELVQFYQILYNFLENKSLSINELLEENLNAFIGIYNLFKCKSRELFTSKFENFLSNVICAKYFPDLKNIEDYETYVTRLFSLKYTRPINNNARITIAKYADCLYIDATEVIFSGFNQENIIPSTEENIWMTQKILKKLGLYSEEEDFEKIRYLIEAKLHLNNATITRPLYNSGELLEKCSILNFISNISESKIIKSISNLKPQISYELEVSNYQFPKTLYASNIELLMRNPYGFVIRKIFKIIPHKNFTDSPLNNTFGSIAHKILENITDNKKNLKIENIITNCFDEFQIPILQRKIWQNPLIKISNQLEIINKKALINGFNIFSEILGEFELLIKDNKIKISAVADRIEISEDKIRIIDFKTGSVPTKSEVNSGKSPQLIIEAIILAKGGFNNIELINQSIDIVYYKISTKEPYIEEKVIQISKKELELHLLYMIKLLEYYYSSPNIFISSRPLPDSWKSVFDDYDFFRRLL